MTLDELIKQQLLGRLQLNDDVLLTVGDKRYLLADSWEFTTDEYGRIDNARFLVKGKRVYEFALDPIRIAPYSVLRLDLGTRFLIPIEVKTA